MPSVDVVSKLDMQEIDNAINSVQKELSQRYDFRNSKSKVELNKTEKTLTILADDDMKYKGIAKDCRFRKIGIRSRRNDSSGRQT